MGLGIHIGNMGCVELQLHVFWNYPILHRLSHHHQVWYQNPCLKTEAFRRSSPHVQGHHNRMNSLNQSRCRRPNLKLWRQSSWVLASGARRIDLLKP